MNSLRKHVNVGAVWALLWIAGVLTGVLIGLVLAAAVVFV